MRPQKEAAVIPEALARKRTPRFVKVMLIGWALMIVAMLGVVISAILRPPPKTTEIPKPVETLAAPSLPPASVAAPPAPDDAAYENWRPHKVKPTHSGTVHVHGYYRHNGTYVHSYDRRWPGGK